MERIVIVGLNHKTAPVEIRERLAATCGDIQAPLQRLGDQGALREWLYLSTCNRVELLFTTNALERGLDAALRTMAAMYGGDSSGLRPYLYTHIDQEAVRHLFRVASSLDSMVVGEPQILGQLKDAYRQARETGGTKVILNRLLPKAFSVAKRVRTETNIGRQAVSVSSAAVELARKIFGDLNGKVVLLIGAGEMAELAAEHLLSQGAADILVANRTLERALALARRFGGSSVPMDSVPEELCRVDIVITSTGAPGFVIEAKQVRARMRARRNRPLFVIDIAVPRDVDPEVNRIDNVYLYNIDDLQAVVELNREERWREAAKAEHLIAAEALKFDGWLRGLEVVPTIISLRAKAEAVRRQEIKKSLTGGSLSPEDYRRVEVLTRSIVAKILHDPIMYLKKIGTRADKQALLDQVSEMFNLAAADSTELSSSEGRKAEASRSR